MTDPIIKEARKRAADWLRENNCNSILIAAAERGDYDGGTYVTRWIPDVLRDRKEATDNE